MFINVIILSNAGSFPIYGGGHHGIFGCSRRPTSRGKIRSYSLQVKLIFPRTVVLMELHSK